MRVPTRICLALVFALAAGPAAAGQKPGQPPHSHQKASPAKSRAKKHAPADVRLVFPKMNAARGMRLFATKGCVLCHAINGVGGHHAKNLDAHTMDQKMNPFEFTAKMWRMAPVMIAQQREVLGDQITFTGQEIADIIAFVHDDRQQHKFTEAMIPPKMRKLMKHTHGSKPAHQKELHHRHMMHQ